MKEGENEETAMYVVYVCILDTFQHMRLFNCNCIHKVLRAPCTYCSTSVSPSSRILQFPSSSSSFFPSFPQSPPSLFLFLFRFPLPSASLLRLPTLPCLIVV